MDDIFIYTYIGIEYFIINDRNEYKLPSLIWTQCNIQYQKALELTYSFLTEIIYWSMKIKQNHYIWK